MNKDKIKGIRIRKSYEHLTPITKSIVFVLVLITLLRLTSKLTNSDVINLISPNINGLIFLCVLILITIIIVTLLSKLVKAQLNFLRNIETLAKVIMNNGFYIMESKNMNTKILYFPDFRYWEDSKEIIISIKLDGSKFHRKYLDMGDIFSDVYNAELTKKVVGNCYCVYTLEKITKGNRIKITDEMEVIENEIPIMKNLSWKIDQSVHMYVSGATRSGKSWFLKHLIKKMLEMKAVVKIIDPKNSELSELKELIGEKNIATTTGQTLRILREAQEEMERRYEDKATRKNNKNYFVIFDEYVAAYSAASNKEREEITKYLRQIILKAAEAKIYLILATQRGDTQFLEGSLREQLSTRILLGNGTREAQKMAFGNIENELKTCTEIGQGYTFMNGMLQVRSIYSPWIPKDYDYKEDLKRILNMNSDVNLSKEVIEGTKELEALETV